MPPAPLATFCEMTGRPSGKLYTAITKSCPRIATGLVGSVSVIIVSALFVLGLPLVLL